MAEREILLFRAMIDVVLTVAYLIAIPVFAWLFWQLVCAVRSSRLFGDDKQPPKE